MCIYFLNYINYSVMDSFKAQKMRCKIDTIDSRNYKLFIETFHLPNILRNIKTKANSSDHRKQSQEAEITRLRSKSPIWSRKRCLNRALTIYHNRNHHAPNIWSMEVVKWSATASLQTLPKVVLVKCLWTIKLRLHCLCVKDSRHILLTTEETMYLQ